MPIKPENRALYPDDWLELGRLVKERAHHRCEWCGVPDGAIIRRKAACPAMWIEASRVPPALDDLFRQPITIHLAPAHLDRKLNSHALHNLIALCQRCHLSLDKDRNPLPKCFRPPTTGGVGTQPNTGD